MKPTWLELNLRRQILLLATAVVMSGCAAAYNTTDEIVLPPWVESGPSADDIRDAYPQSAEGERVAGLAMLICTIRNDRKLDCVLGRESPEGYGFGAAALRLSHLIVAKAAASDPHVRVGARIAVPIRFQIPDD